METLPNASFKVQLESGAEILAHVSGKMRMRYIRILPGDVVEMEVSPYDPTRGRIIWRHKWKLKQVLKKRGPNDQIVRRKGKLYVINKRNPRHKQRQG